MARESSSRISASAAAPGAPARAPLGGRRAVFLFSALLILAAVASCARSQERNGEPRPTFVSLHALEPSRVESADAHASRSAASIPLDASGWRAGIEGARVDAGPEGALRGRSESGDVVLLSPETAIEADAWSAVEVEFRVWGASRVDLFWRGADEPGFNPKTLTALDAPAEGVWYRRRLPASRLKRWRGTIQGFGVHVPHREGVATALEIREISLWDDLSAFADSAYGWTRHAIDDLSRPCLFAHAPAIVEYEIAFPESARFEAGVAVVPAQDGATLRFAITDARGKRVAVHETRVDSSERWRPVSFELPAAPANGRLRLEAEAAPGTVVLWADPVVYAARAPERPSIAIYLIDCLRADRIGHYGHARARTPALDAFGKEALTFPDAYANCTWTRPSVASIMTSRFPKGHGVRAITDHLLGSYLTLAERLAAEGYETVGFSANPNSGPAASLEQGFSRLYVRGTNRADEKYGRDLDRLREWASERAPGARPAFLFIHTIECHGPYLPPEPFASAFAEPGQPELAPAILYDPLQPKANLSERDLRFLSARFDATVMLADRNFGETVDVLRLNRLYDDSYLFLIADHGESLGEHGLFGHDGAPFEEQIRVPCVVRAPQGRRAAPAFAEEPIQLVDLMPTILDVAGVPAAAASGVSRRAALEGARRFASTIFAEQTSRPAVAVIAEREKLVVRTKKDGVETQLFRLATDPREQHPGPMTDSTLWERFLAWDSEQVALASAHRDSSGHDPQPALDSESEARLRALGYVD